MKSKGTVLVVEDHSICREPLVQILSLSGYTVKGAEDGVEALAVMGEQRFDLIITDLMMPRMDGISLMQAVRSNANWQATPIIAISAAGEGEVIHQAKSLAANVMLKSKFSVQDLLGTIETLIPTANSLKVAA